MSTEALEIIKQQIATLSRQERAELSQFLEAHLKLEAEGSPRQAQLSVDDEIEQRRLRNMEWMKANSQEFGGQYIAIEDGHLINTGRTFREARETAIAAGKNQAFVTYLPKPDEILEMGGWM